MMPHEPLPDESPFVTVWEAPRATIRRIVDTDPRHRVNWLFFVSGVVGGLDAIPAWAQRIEMPLVAVPIVCLLMGAFTVPTGHMNAWYKRWVGGLLGGAASRQEVAAVNAWATVPVIVGHTGLWIIRVALYGRELYSPEHPTIDAASGLVRITFALATALFTLWAAVIVVAGFAEVNRFSIARSIAASIIAVTIVIVTALACAAALVYYNSYLFG